MTFSKQKAEHYSIVKGMEWAEFFIIDHEKSGSISVISTFGNYAYHYSNIGSQKFKEFLTKTSFHSFMGKTFPEYDGFDCDKTIEAIKKDLFEARREKELSKEQVRDYYDEIEYLYCHTDEVSFNYEFQDLQVASFFDFSPSEFKQTSISSQAQGFWDEFWIPFTKMLTEELQQEDKLAVDNRMPLQNGHISIE